VDVAAFVPLSLSDHDGHVAAVVFVPGCNFRCPFCHNPDLVLPERAAGGPRVPVDEVLDELRDRRDFLDSVVVSGGEPTLQPGLQEFLASVRAMGLRVKLDTNGSRPDVLRPLFEGNLVDYVAMDIKAPPARYAEFAGVPVDLARIEESIRLIRSMAPDYEFRTTVAPGLVAEDLRAVADWISGAKRYILQPFSVPPEKGLLDPAWSDREALSAHALRDIWTLVAPLVGGGGVRAPV
jgi:pyruvate formate lyase activating enzyme